MGLLKRQRPSHTTNEGQEEEDGSSSRPKATKSTPKKRRGNAGKLSRMNDIPTDVFLEIASHLTPLDILHMARTTKAWRAILMHPSSQPIWRAARTNNRCPECPVGMSEPFYAGLLYGHMCQLCGDKTRSPQHAILLVRLCKSCQAYMLCKPNELKERMPSLTDELLDFLIAFEERHGPRTKNGRLYANTTHYYLPAVKKMVADAEAQLKKFPLGSLDKEYRQWLSEKKRCKVALMQSAEEIDYWLKETEIEKREEQMEAELVGEMHVQERQQAIYEKLEALGHSIEDISYAKNLYPSVYWIRKRELTDEEWNRIGPRLEEQVRQAHVHRLTQNKEARQIKERAALYRSSFFRDAEIAVCSAAREPVLRMPWELVRSLPSIVLLWSDRLEVVSETDWPTANVLQEELAQLRGRIKLHIRNVLDEAASEDFPGEAAQHILRTSGYPPLGRGRSTRLYYNDYALPANFKSLSEPFEPLRDGPSDRGANISVRLDKSVDIVSCMLCHSPLVWPELLLHDHHNAVEPGTGKAMTFRSHEWTYSCKLYCEILSRILEDAWIEKPESVNIEELERLPRVQCTRCGKGAPWLTWKALVQHIAEKWFEEQDGQREQVSRSDQGAFPVVNHDPRSAMPIVRWFDGARRSS